MIFFTTNLISYTAKTYTTPWRKTSQEFVTSMLEGDKFYS